MEVNFQCFKAGSQTSESEGAACLNLLQCLWESCQTRTRSVLLSFSRQKGVLHLKHKHSAVLSLPEVQCHAAVPPSPSSHGKGVWEGLSSIFSHCQRPHIQKTHTCTHTQTLAIPHIYTNNPSGICKHKRANKQTRINVCAYLHIFLIGIVRSVFRLSSDLRMTLFTRLLAQYGLPLLSQADI